MEQEKEKDQDKKPEVDLKALEAGIKKVLAYGPWRPKPKKESVDKVSPPYEILEES